MNLYIVSIIIVCLLYPASAFSADKIYKWVDENGVQCFSNVAPPDKKFGDLDIRRGFDRPKYPAKIVKQKKKVYRSMPPQQKLNFRQSNYNLIRLEEKKLKNEIDTYKQKWGRLVRSYTDFDGVLEKTYKARISGMESNLQQLQRDPETYFYSRGRRYNKQQAGNIEQRVKELEWKATQVENDNIRRDYYIRQKK